MISPDSGDSKVSLTIPMRAEYVSIARLTAAGVANRLGFDIETIEDIKVSLSEVCNRIINTQKKHSGDSVTECKIEFLSSANSLNIGFFVDSMESIEYFVRDDASSRKDADGAAGNGMAGNGFDVDRHLEENYEDQLQLSLITLLMDEFVVHPEENCLVSMKKYLD